MAIEKPKLFFANKLISESNSDKSFVPCAVYHFDLQNQIQQRQSLICGNCMQSMCLRDLNIGPVRRPCTVMGQINETEKFHKAFEVRRLSTKICMTGRNIPLVPCPESPRCTVFAHSAKASFGPKSVSCSFVLKFVIARACFVRL